MMLPGCADASGPQTALGTVRFEALFLKGGSAMFPTQELCDISSQPYCLLNGLGHVKSGPDM